MENKAGRVLIHIKNLKVFFFLLSYVLIHSASVRAEHAFQANGLGSELSKRAEISSSENPWEKWDKIRAKSKEQTTLEQKCLFSKEIVSAVSVEEIPDITFETMGLKIIEPVLELDCKGLTPAQKARAFIRLNLARIKAKIVLDVLKLIKANPPKPVPTKGSNYEIANDLADAYIRFTDQFLKEHYGAKPALGSRYEIFGWQNSINAPWCADWAEGLLSYLMNHFPANHPIHQWLRIQWAQMHGPEHNFVVVYPYGNPPRMPPESPSQSLLILDPWKTITPKTYFPGDPDWAANRVPENLGIK